MNTKFVALAMVMLLVAPAVAINPIDLLLHPSYLIKSVMKFLGLEQSTEDKIMESDVTQVPAEYQAAIDKLYTMLEAVTPDVIGADIGENVNEFVYLAFTENDNRYAEWSVLIQNGKVVAFEQGVGEFGSPTMFVRLDGKAMNTLTSSQTGDEIMDSAFNLYLDGHIELEPEDKAIGYISQFMG